MNEFERDEYVRLIMCKTIQDNNDVFDIYLGYFLLIINNFHSEPFTSEKNENAKMINQMLFSKVAYLKKTLEGINFVSHNNVGIKGIIDPTVLAVLTRNVYETVSIFHLIYIYTKNEDEKTILYGLWKSSGLKYRQRFETGNDENKQKSEAEKKLIIKIQEDIEDTTLYKTLSKKNQNKVLKALKKKDYKIMFNEKNEVVSLSWQEITDTMNSKKDVSSQIYNYFSQYSHPSYISVFQFSQMFSDKDQSYKIMTNFNLKILFMLLSVFTTDYIKLFPSTKTIFEKLSLRDKSIIRFYYNMFTT